MTQSFSTSVPEKRSIFSLQLSGILEVVMLLVGIATLFSFVSTWSWIFYLTCHFRVQYAIAFVIGGCGLLWQKRWKSVALVGLGLIVNLLYIFPLYLPQDQRINNTTSSLRVVTFNIFWKNHNRDKVIEFLRKIESANGSDHYPVVVDIAIHK